MAPQSVILGASNCTRFVFENPNVHIISVSGTTLDQVQKNCLISRIHKLIVKMLRVYY
jgi:hypothetical protein